MSAASVIGATAVMIVTLATRLGQVGPQEVRGIVTDENGRPLAGVHVSWSGEETAADGTFTLRVQARERLRFTRDGYAPIMGWSDELGRPLIMPATTTPPRTVPRCLASSPGDGLRILRLHTPAGQPISSVIGDDTLTLSWPRSTTTLYMNFGAMLTYGLPRWETTVTLRDVEDRDVRLAGDAPEELRPLRITDYRGVRPDGSRYRFVGMLFEFVEYDNASADDAAFFDRMLDTMCYAGSVETPAQPKL